MENTNFNIIDFEKNFKKKVNENASDLNWNSREIFEYLSKSNFRRVESYYYIYAASNLREKSEDLFILQINLLWKVANQDMPWFLEELKKLFLLGEKNYNLRILIAEELPKLLNDLRIVDEWFIRNFMDENTQIIQNLLLIKNEFKSLVININEDKGRFNKKKFKNTLSNINFFLSEQDSSRCFDEDLKENFKLFILNSQILLDAPNYNFEKFKNFFIEKFERIENKFERLLDFFTNIQEILIQD